MDELNPEDPLPALIAGLDQAAAVAPHLARISRAQFDAFRAEGFTDSQAIYLVACNIVENPLGPA